MNAPVTLDQPVRRSALETVHARVGTLPMRASEALDATARKGAGTQSRVGLGEIGPLDVLSVAGPRAPGALAEVGLDCAVGRVTLSGSLEVWGLAGDEALVLTAAGADPPVSLADLADRLRTARALVTDLSSGYTALRLAGHGADEVLADASPVELVSALSDGAISQAPVIGVRMIVARQDGGQGPGYTLLVPRDLAEYAWSTLMAIGEVHGLVPVGGAATRANAERS